MKKIVLIPALLISASFLLSCTKVVDYNLVSADPKVVIESRIITDSFAMARVTTTAPYLNNQPTPVISNAFIVITDNLGNKDTLNYTTDGYYVCDNMKGNTANTYTLSVNAQGQTYTAVTSIPPAVPFTITGVDYKDGQSSFEKKGYYPTITATLPSGDSYYLFKYYKNDSVYRKNNSDLNVTDSKFVGTSISGYETPQPYQVNDVARIDIYTLTKEGYNFWNDLDAQLHNDGGFFSTPPANTSTNFNNGAIGLFQGSSVSTQSITITP
ncbi:MAG TPA: DUF4249 domain-containing protein [Cytophagaceae bacterium]|jgi:hypothetical protein|nr:DUF4249 domain-containing protein [Cytophagaceae bacterium]